MQCSSGKFSHNKTITRVSRQRQSQSFRQIINFHREHPQSIYIRLLKKIVPSPFRKNWRFYCVNFPWFDFEFFLKEHFANERQDIDIKTATCLECFRLDHYLTLSHYLRTIYTVSVHYRTIYTLSTLYTLPSLYLFKNKIILAGADTLSILSALLSTRYLHTHYLHYLHSTLK